MARSEGKCAPAWSRPGRPLAWSTVRGEGLMTRRVDTDGHPGSLGSVSRRDFLVRLTLGLAGASAASLLAACGGGAAPASAPTSGAAAAPTSTPAAAPTSAPAAAPTTAAA